MILAVLLAEYFHEFMHAMHHIMYGELAAFDLWILARGGWEGGKIGVGDEKRYPLCINGGPGSEYMAWAVSFGK